MPDWEHRKGWEHRGPPRHLFPRVVFGLLLLFIVIGPLLVAIGGVVLRRLSGPYELVVLGFGLLIVVAMILFARRMFGRTWAPVGDLIDATQRLGDGDTGVRIAARGPGPFREVGASFNRMAARLEEEDERRRRLLADLGHELRTPLTVIRGEVEAVIDGVHDPQSLDTVIDEVELMERLLEDLRVLTLAEAGRLQLHKEVTDVENLIGDVVASFSTAIEARQVKGTVAVAPTVGEIEVDPYRLRQVLANLISNALNQMPAGGVLSVNAAGSAGWVEIEVADSGPGIPPDRLEQVFQRFTKAGDSTGTGLGLSIARDLVEAHGGTLEAGNRPEGGAVFTVRIPAAVS